MERELLNKTVIITGGAQGIGFACAEKFLDNGVRSVILVDLDAKLGEAAVEILNAKHDGNKVEFYRGDVTTDLDDLATKILSKHKYVDVLVNNAGILKEKSIRDTLNVNTIALMEWSMKFFEHMRKDRGGAGGTIINMASIYGFVIDPFLPIYKASKFAVVGFTKSFGHPLRYKQYGVRVVALCPGFTKTMLTSNMMTNDEPNLHKAFTDMVEGVKWLDVDVVADATVYIFAEANSGTAWAIAEDKPLAEV